MQHSFARPEMRIAAAPGTLWGFALRFVAECTYISGDGVVVEFTQALTDREAFRMTGRKSVYHLSVMIGSG
jgi:hypothetical protein